MQNENFNLTFFVNQSPKEVFDAVNNVKNWWSESLEGNSEKVGDEFIYRHKEFHYSKHKVVESLPNEKVVWLTTDSKLTFVEKQDEWNGTKMIFEISKDSDKTKLEITHLGLTPEFQCFEGCSRGWTHYLKNSLLPLIETGNGNPDKK